MKNYLVYALYGISDGGVLERCLNLVNQPEKLSRDEVLRKVSETYGIIPLDISIKEN